MLKEDKSSQALAELTSCKGDPLVDGGTLDGFILQAKIASAFDSKNYNLFVTVSKEQLALDTTLAMSWAQVASAYACAYAQNGTEPDKNQALLYLDKAKSMDHTDKDLLNYYNAIEYRVETKDIITRDVFNQRFPQGWHKN